MSTKAKRDIEYATHETAKVVFWTTVAVTDITKTLKLYEHTLIVNTAAAAGTLTMPNVTEARGLSFTIILRTAGNNLVIQDSDESEDWPGDYTLDVAHDNVELHSNGVRWEERVLEEH